MAHYDGPPFLRDDQPQPHQDYPLPPKAQRTPQPQAPSSSQSRLTHPAPEVADAGRHSVDPLAALSTPKSVVRRDPVKPKINYQVLLASLKRADEDVYLFTADAPDDEDEDQASAVESDLAQVKPMAPDTQDRVAHSDAEVCSQTSALDAQVSAADAQHVETDAEADLTTADTPLSRPTVGDDTAAPDSLRSASAVDAKTSAGDPALKPSVEAEVPPANTPESTAEVAAEGPKADSMLTQSSNPAAKAEAAASTQPAPTATNASAEPAPAASAAAEQPAAVDKPMAAKRPTPLLPSQTDPLKQAQQAKIEAALAKQKKTVYANWRPVQLPDRRALRQAVDTYKHHSRDKALPRPAATRDAASSTPVATEPTKQVSQPLAPTAKPVDQAVAVAQTAAQPSAFKPADQANAQPEAQAPYVFPPLDLLPKPVNDESPQQDQWVQDQAQRLDETLDAFHVGAHVVAHTIGPTVTQFQVALDAGVKVNKITNLNDDLKLALAAKDIRIEAPIPGKTTVGIEIPNLHPRPVMLREVLQSQAFKDAKSPLTIALGVDLFGQPVVTNINKMPHGLIAGATGSGKSVFINSLLTSLLYKATPEEVRLLLIDPKAVELAVYNNLPHLVSPVISEPKAAAEALKWAVEEMEERYQKLAAAGVRNLAQFNQKAKAHGDFGMVMPYIVIIIDELADLMMVAASEVQDYIARITQKARAAGIHLIVATQRPSVDVITGTIKNNIPTRIAFMVASQTDSRTIIDANGAERLLGRGDMLYLGSGASQAIRLQGTFIDEDIATVVDFVKAERPPRYLFQPDGLLAQAEASEAQDDLFPQVLEYIAQEKHVSTSKLQRVFSIGYNRAANLIDELEMRHYISPANGSKPRDVYFTKEDLPENPQ
ncbi:DNA translocase FtsK [Lacticaseibacillus jixiensis]|uniref:DNA translocase FtsK n=1 Tax=Lacticaseibacillus jixiensis TaxID=3231926 RepID=UPI0036F39137